MFEEPIKIKNPEKLNQTAFALLRDASDYTKMGIKYWRLAINARRKEWARREAADEYSSQVVGKWVGFKVKETGFYVVAASYLATAEDCLWKCFGATSRKESKWEIGEAASQISRVHAWLEFKGRATAKADTITTPASEDYL